ncbi:hypothetical protein QTP88_002658 [Uroleucon formosanum]
MRVLGFPKTDTSDMFSLTYHRNRLVVLCTNFDGKNKNKTEDNPEIRTLRAGCIIEPEESWTSVGHVNVLQTFKANKCNLMHYKQIFANKLIEKIVFLMIARSNHLIRFFNELVKVSKFEISYCLLFSGVACNIKKSCMSKVLIMTYKLTYFNFTALDEPIRFLLTYLIIDFEDNYIKVEPRLSIKHNTTYYGKVSLLEIDGKVKTDSIINHQPSVDPNEEPKALKYVSYRLQNQLQTANEQKSERITVKAERHTIFRTERNTIQRKVLIRVPVEKNQIKKLKDAHGSFDRPLRWRKYEYDSLMNDVKKRDSKLDDYDENNGKNKREKKAVTETIFTIILVHNLLVLAVIQVVAAHLSNFTANPLGNTDIRVVRRVISENHPPAVDEVIEKHSGQCFISTWHYWLGPDGLISPALRKADDGDEYHIYIYRISVVRSPGADCGCPAGRTRISELYAAGPAQPPKQ